MTRIPTVTARELAQALQRAGFELSHQRGSHRHFHHPGLKRFVTVPMHSGDLKRPLLKAILKQAGLSEDEFRKFL
jgi:predicted RNA binding protein YcfA (HicA-like mRNA interferase family)